jgi:hypothetical protein
MTTPESTPHRGAARHTAHLNVQRGPARLLRSANGSATTTERGAPAQLGLRGAATSVRRQVLADTLAHNLDRRPRLADELPRIT